MESTGKMIMLAGGALLIVGAFIYYLGRSGMRFGNLPGNIHINTGAGTCVIALGASLVLSILLTVILNLMVKWFRP